MSIRIALAALVIAYLPMTVLAQKEPISRAPLQFGVLVDGACSPDDALTREASATAVVAAQMVGKAFLSVVGSALEEAGKDKTVIRVGTAAGALYSYSKEGKLELRTDARCIRFWYAKRGVGVVSTDEDEVVKALTNSSDLAWTDKDRPLLRVWAKLGMVEIPYVYGEVAIAATSNGSALAFQSRRYFARPAPDLQRGWGPAPFYAVSMQLHNVGEDTAFALHGLGLYSPIDSAVLMTTADLTGMSSGVFAGPTLQSPIKDASPTITGRFTARVMLTATQPGSKLAKAFGGALVTDNEPVLKILTAKLSGSKAEEQGLQEAVFDAEVDVAELQAQLDAADAVNKPPLAARLQKAKFTVNIKREAAGLSRKYDVQL